MGLGLLMEGAQKFVGLLITVGQAVAYVVSGMYGSVGDLGIVNAALIILQLCAASVLVMCLDEMLSRGWGFGSGISLFIAGELGAVAAVGRLRGERRPDDALAHVG